MMDRQDASDLLPYLVNGTLEGEARAEVEALLARDPALAAERDALKAVRATMQAEPVESPGEAGLARLMAEVEATTPANTNARPWIWQVAAAVLLAVVLAQGAFLITRDGAPGYELAGGEAPALTVAFQGAATEAALRALLLDAGVEIVSGPSALGLYGLEPVEGVSVEEAQAALLASPLVESVERTGE
jgi:anti-sigma factor RsiW